MNPVKKHQSGIALFFAILITSVSLMISLGVATLTIGEIGLSGSVRESQLAFYAADSGAECAIYWDLKRQKFSTSTTEQIICNNETKNVGNGSISSFSLGFDNGSCVDVIVDKSILNKTKIIALGYNSGNVVGGVCSPEGRAVQRGLEVTY